MPDAGDAQVAGECKVGGAYAYINWASVSVHEALFRYLRRVVLAAASLLTEAPGGGRIVLSGGLTNAMLGVLQTAPIYSPEADDRAMEAFCRGSAELGDL